MKNKQPTNLTEELYGSNLTPEPCKEYSDYLDDIWHVWFLVTLAAVVVLIGSNIIYVCLEALKELP